MEGNMTKIGGFGYKLYWSGLLAAKYHLVWMVLSVGLCKPAIAFCISVSTVDSTGGTREWE